MKHYAQADIGIENFMKELRSPTISYLKEASIDWYYEAIDKDFIDQYYLDDCIEYLLSKEIEQKEIENNLKDMYIDISNAINQAYRDNNLNYIIECIEDAIKDFANEINCTGFYYLDHNNNKTKYIYEAFDIRFYYTKKDYDKIILQDFVDNYAYTKKELKEWKHEYCDEYVNSFNFNQPLLDSRYCPDDNGWLDMYKDYEETSYHILKNRKEKQNRIKNQIKNNVALIYR